MDPEKRHIQLLLHLQKSCHLAEAASSLGLAISSSPCVTPPDKLSSQNWHDLFHYKLCHHEQQRFAFSWDLILTNATHASCRRLSQHCNIA